MDFKINNLNLLFYYKTFFKHSEIFYFFVNSLFYVI